MREDVKQALRSRSVSFFGAFRELRTIREYLHDDEIVEDVVACLFGDKARGRGILVATNERVLAVKHGWIFRQSQGMSYKDIRSIDHDIDLFFSTIQFHGEGMEFNVRKVGRFAGTKFVTLVRSRIGRRYETWSAEESRKQTEEQQAFTQPINEIPTQLPSQPQNPFTGSIPVAPASPHTLDEAADILTGKSPGTQPNRLPDRNDLMKRTQDLHQEALQNPFPMPRNETVDRRLPSIQSEEIMDDGNFFALMGQDKETEIAEAQISYGSLALMDELDELETLKRKGRITESEYHDRRRGLLGF